jgi:hypothetical protein
VDNVEVSLVTVIIVMPLVAVGVEDIVCTVTVDVGALLELVVPVMAVDEEVSPVTLS